MTEENEVNKLLSEMIEAEISRRKFLERLVVTAGGFAVTSFLASCAPAPSPSPEATVPLAASPTKVAPTPTTAPSPTVGPRLGGHLIAALEYDPPSLDAHKYLPFSVLQANEHVYEGLTEFDRNLNIVPCLAESWEMPDDQTYVFHLRKGVKWHDDTDFVADDVKYSFERLLDPETGAPMMEALTVMEKVEAIDKHTVKISLSAVSPWFLGALAHRRSTVIMQAGAAEKMNLDMEAIGTGPFKLVEFAPGDKLDYVKFDGYWNQPLPYVERFTYKIMPEEEGRIAGLRTGALHFASLSPEGAERIEGEEHIEILQFPKAWLQYLNVNVGREPFTDVRVRQAIQYALDRQDIIDKATAGTGVLSGPITTGFGDWCIPVEELEEMPEYRQDTARAKELLAEAGYPDGFETEILVRIGYPQYVAVGVVVAEQLKEVGIEVKVTQLESADFSKRVVKAGGYDYDMLTGAATFRSDPDAFICQYILPEGAYNVGYDNPIATDLCQRAGAATDTELRHQLYRELQEITIKEIPAYMFLYAASGFHAIRDTLKGYYPNWGDLRAQFKEVWLEEA